MIFNPYSSLQKWLIRLAIFCLTITILFWVSSQVFLPSFVKKSLADYGGQIGYEISYQDLHLSPLSLGIELDGFKLAKKNGGKLLEVKQLGIVLKWTKILLGEIGFDQVRIEEPKLFVEKRGSLGVWNWQELIQATQKNASPDDPQQAKKPLKISVDELIVNAGSLSLIDESTKLRQELKPFSLKLLNVANYDKSGAVSGLRGQYDFNLGSLQLFIPGINKTLAFKQVAIGGGLDNPSFNRLGVQLDLRLDEGSIRSHWDLNTETKALEGKVKIENLSAGPLIVLLPANKELIASSGTLNADLVVKLSSEIDIFSGELHLINLSVIEKGEKAPLLAWSSADIRHFEYSIRKSAGAAQTSALAIDEVMIDRPLLRFEINEQGLSNFRRLFSKQNPDPAKLDEAQESNSKANSTKESFALDIRTVNMKNGEVYFSDFAMRPNFKVDVQKFNATFLGVSNLPDHSATVAMDGVVAGSGSMRAKGQASFEDPRRNHDILMSFRNLPLITFNPAVMTYAGHQIIGGNLNLNLSYKAKDGQLNGSNQIIIKKVKLGDEVADFQGKKLPLGLAIALLEDSDDTIDVTINISGNVDSPEFSASGLVWQALSNVLTNVATAPFRALASLLGMGSNEGVNAVPGEAVFLLADQERLEKFGEYLAKRGNSSLEIIGTYDAIQDRQELARVKVDTAILTAAGFKLTSGEPVPLPSLSDPRVQSGLRSAYAQYIGRLKLGQRLLTLPEGEARNDQLRSELIAGMEITDNELKALAKSRAEVAFDFMVRASPTLRERIQIGEVKAVEGGREGIPLDLEVRIK